MQKEEKDASKEKVKNSTMIESAVMAAEATGFSIFGADFLCRSMAILHCYGGGPGGEYFRAPVGQIIAKKGAETLEKAVKEKDWEYIRKFQAYVSELQKDKAEWLPMTLDRLNIPPGVIKYKECLGAPVK